MTADTAIAAALLERECFSRPWSLKGLLEQLGNPAAVFITATVNGCIAGYAGLHHILDEGYIMNLAVGEKFRRAGVASELLRFYIGYAGRGGLALLSLEVRESNLPAHRLYEKHGFLMEGRRKNYYEYPREDALILTLRDFKSVDI